MGISHDTMTNIQVNHKYCGYEYEYLALFYTNYDYWYEYIYND